MGCIVTTYSISCYRLCNSTYPTALKNSQNVRGPVVPVFCGEGVYHNAADKGLSNPEESRDMFPMMGAFYMTKIALKCARKHLVDSIMDDALVEAEIFGSQVFHSVMNGSKYFHAVLEQSLSASSLQELHIIFDRNKYIIECGTINLALIESRTLIPKFGL